MSLRDSLVLDAGQRDRLERLYARYRRMHEDPAHCEPAFLVETPVSGLPTIRQQLEDPAVMLEAEMASLRPHLEMEDDRVPTVRVQFGTAQIAAAFGCPMHVYEDSLPCAGAPAMRCAEDVYHMTLPGPDAGWYGKLAAFTAFFRDNLPDGVFIQHPDIQSPFNSAHLIRGNGILTDFYDCPEAVEALLDLVTDFMIALVPRLNRMIDSAGAWFFDWGALWRGRARISNCSMHMISPAFYERHVLPRDLRLMRAIGGGRIHYCGTGAEVIPLFFSSPHVHGFDYDWRHHDLWTMCERVPARVVLSHGPAGDQKTLERLLAGDWPKKRNIILQVAAGSVEEGRDLLRRLRTSVPSD